MWEMPRKVSATSAASWSMLSCCGVLITHDPKTQLSSPCTQLFAPFAVISSVAIWL